ncbi:MAG: hypothetical protein ACTS3R_04380 [Inquilinaceae bacterium]
MSGPPPVSGLPAGAAGAPSVAATAADVVVSATLRSASDTLLQRLAALPRAIVITGTVLAQSADGTARLRTQFGEVGVRLPVLLVPDRPVTIQVPAQSAPSSTAAIRLPLDVRAVLPPGTVLTPEAPSQPAVATRTTPQAPPAPLRGAPPSPASGGPPGAAPPPAPALAAATAPLPGPGSGLASVVAGQPAAPSVAPAATAAPSSPGGPTAPAQGGGAPTAPSLAPAAAGPVAAARTVPPPAVPASPAAPTAPASPAVKGIPSAGAPPGPPAPAAGSGPVSVLAREVATAMAGAAERGLAVARPIPAPLPPLDAGPSALPALREVLTTLAAMDSALSRHLTQSVLPQPGPQMSPGVLFFLSAVRGGDLRTWLGDRASRLLETAGKGDLIARAGAELGQTGRAGPEPMAGEWRSHTVPVLHDGRLTPMHIHIQRSIDGRGQTPGQSRDAEQRFVLDLDLSRLGAVQVDGRLRRTRFDLILRSQRALPPEMRSEVSSLFGSVCEASGLTGHLACQAGGHDWMRLRRS